MKVLVISEIRENSAPGMVFLNLIQEMSRVHKVDLLTNSVISDSNKSRINVDKYILFKTSAIDFDTNAFKLRKLSIYLKMFSYVCFKYSILDKKTSKSIDVDLNEYDLIVSFCSSYRLLALEIGHQFAKRIKCKFACYFVDAIPEPTVWIKSNIDGLSRGLSKYLNYLKTYFSLCSSSSIEKYIRSRTKFVTYFASSNKPMLNYEINYLHPNCIKTDVILTPNLGIAKVLPNPDSKNIIFLYAGGLYGLRKSKFFFEAFHLFLKRYPNSFIHFIGTNPHILCECPVEIRHRVKFFPFTQNLDPFYQQATVLVDIDAAIDNDVYLSSKVTNYLLINRPIICETGNNSPSRSLFHGIKSIIPCTHNSVDFFKAMISSVESSFDFSDRRNIISDFSAKQVVKKFFNNI